MFVRQCPTCEKELTYKSEYYLKRAIKRNKPCNSCSQKGKPLSKEHKAKIAKGMKGKQNGLGYKHTEEAKQKIVIANTGKTLSEETKRNISISKGGNGVLDKDQWNHSKLLQWSRRVRKRDCHCQKCNSTENLEAHHIIDKIIMPDLAYEEWNGITLCKPCHIELHKEIV